MDIDNSKFVKFFECPLKYFERYEQNLELDWSKIAPGAREFGTRMHQIFEEYYKDMAGTPIPPYPPLENEAVEAETELTFQTYLNHYPGEQLQVVDVERTFQVPLPTCGHLTVGEYIDNDGIHVVCCTTCGAPVVHSYCGKFDLVIVDAESGKLEVWDHKTEGRRSFTNDPEAWAMRTQATLYLWAARQLYKGPFRGLIINRIRRQSDKGQKPPEFFRQRLERSDEQIRLAVRDLGIVTNQIEEYRRKFANDVWPANRNLCKSGFYGCEYYKLHAPDAARDLVILKDYRQAEPYLDL